MNDAGLDFTQKPETTEQSANKAKYLKIPPWLIRFLSVDFSERSQLPAAVREFLMSAAVRCFCCSVVFCVLATDVVLQLSDVRIWRSCTSSTTIWVS